MINTVPNTTSTTMTTSRVVKTKKRVILLMLIAAFVFVAGPYLFDPFQLSIINKAFFFAIVAITVDVLWGYTGYLTFAQGAFFGIGAYAAGLMFNYLGFSPKSVVLGMLAAVLVAGLVGLLIGWLSFYRKSSPFFATIISLVLPIILVQLVLSGGEYTGSSSGITGYDSFDFSEEQWYWIAGGSLIVVATAVYTFVQSEMGRVLIAMRDNEQRCEYLGINIITIKIILLVCSACLAGMAGFGYAAYSGVVAPELVGFVLGTELVIWVALSGRATIWGVVIGTILINLISSYLSSYIPFIWQLFIGLLFVLVVVILPKGLITMLFFPFLGSKKTPKTYQLIEKPLSKATRQSTETALEINQLTKSYGVLSVLKDISIKAKSGQLIGLIGPNGAGKTTLMRCLSDGDYRSSGHIAICGHSIEHHHSPRHCAAFGLGRKFQNANIFATLTVIESLKLATSMVSKISLFKSTQTLVLPAYALEVLRVTGLDQKLDQIASELSHGEQQALELAMVLAQEPSVVLLDEPTAGLSKAERKKIGDVLSSLVHKYALSCILVEHDLDFVQEVATSVIVLHQGSIVMEGTFNEVVSSDLVKQIYAGTANQVQEA